MKAWLAGTVLALAGCATEQPAPPLAGPLQQAGEWRLQGATDASGVRIEALFPHGDPVHALRFTGNGVGVHGGCNHIGGTYRIEADGGLVIELLHQTAAACVDTSRMDADAAITDLLQGRADWRIAESWPEQLFLDHADGRRSQWVAVREGP